MNKINEKNYNKSFIIKKTDKFYVNSKAIRKLNIIDQYKNSLNKEQFKKFDSIMKGYNKIINSYNFDIMYKETNKNLTIKKLNEKKKILINHKNKINNYFNKTQINYNDFVFYVKYFIKEKNKDVCKIIDFKNNEINNYIKNIDSEIKNIKDLKRNYYLIIFLKFTFFLYYTTRTIAIIGVIFYIFW